MDVKTITLASGATVPALGQGTWYLGDDPAAGRGRSQPCAPAWAQACA